MSHNGGKYCEVYDCENEMCQINIDLNDAHANLHGALNEWATENITVAFGYVEAVYEGIKDIMYSLQKKIKK